MTSPRAATGLTSARWRIPSRIPSGAIVYLGFALIVVVFSILLRDRGFLTVDNFLNILRQTAFVSIMAFGMTYALSAGKIDLSIGQTVALSAMVTALLLRDANAPIAVAAGIGVGLVVGLANGLLTTRLRVPSFLITLGMAGIVGGLSRWITETKPVPGPRRHVHLRCSGPATSGRCRRCCCGRSLRSWSRTSSTARPRSVGSCWPPAATGPRRATRGSTTTRIRVAALVICSFTAALAGMLYVGRLHSARYTLGETDLLTVIAAAVIGGTSMAGGRGRSSGALVGSLVMGVLNNGLILMGLSVTEQMIGAGS